MSIVKKNLKRPVHTVSFLILLFLVCSEIHAGEPKNLQAYYREHISLNGPWKIIIDPFDNGYQNYRMEPFDQSDNAWSQGFYADRKMQTPDELIEYNFDLSQELHVPGDWNTQDPKLFYYEGSVWYRKKFDSPELRNGAHAVLYFGAVNYSADVYLNGKKIGKHTGGFTPFYFEVTGHLKEKDNSLVLRVNNQRLREGVPTVITDWWNYGGITRDVKLIILPARYIRDYSIMLQSASGKIVNGVVHMEGTSGSDLAISVPELGIFLKTKCNAEGTANFSFQSKKIRLWSPEDPKLYRIEIISDNDKLIDSVGFRTVSVLNKQIMLNDKPVFLKGISVHEEYAADGGGRVNSKWKCEQLIGWCSELGCNFMRLSHYPHNEDIIRIAEKSGILVWSEIPVYWTIEWENQRTFENASAQLQENILRDRNRANVIIWSIGNETPVLPVRNEFMRRLAEKARSLDSTRLISAALEKHYITETLAVVEDPLAEFLDVVSFNEYIGWYDGLPEKCDRVSWSIPYNKPVVITEFGGGARYGYHGEKNVRWTEEFQEDLYRRTLNMADSIDGLCGLSPWILADFRSPRRQLAGIQDNFNRKGLYSEKGEKKKAFYVLQEYYRKK